MDRDMARRIVTGQIVLPAPYVDELRDALRRDGVDMVMVWETRAWLASLVLPRRHDRDWMKTFAAIAAEVRDAKAAAKSCGDELQVSVCAYRQVALGVVLRRRAESLGVSPAQVAEEYVAHLRVQGIEEDDLLITVVSGYTPPIGFEEPRPVHLEDLA